MIFLRKLHHHTSRRSDDLPGQENVLQSERLPPGVREAILSRIDRLSEKEADILLEAKTVAEEKEERIFLWQILATLGDLEELREDAAEAEKWRKQAATGDERRIQLRLIEHREK